MTFFSKNWKFKPSVVWVISRWVTSQRCQTQNFTIAWHYHHPWLLFSKNFWTFYCGIWKRPSFTSWLEVQKFWHLSCSHTKLPCKHFWNWPWFWAISIVFTHISLDLSVKNVWFWIILAQSSAINAQTQILAIESWFTPLTTNNLLNGSLFLLQQYY